MLVSARSGLAAIKTPKIIASAGKRLLTNIAFCLSKLPCMITRQAFLGLAQSPIPARRELGLWGARSRTVIQRQLALPATRAETASAGAVAAPTFSLAHLTTFSLFG
jgi:hypothetical protein